MDDDYVETLRRAIRRYGQDSPEVRRLTTCTHPGCTLHRDHHGAHDNGTWPRTVSLDVPEWVAERINQPGPLADPILVAWCVSAIAKAAGIR